MSNELPNSNRRANPPQKKLHPFRRAVLRGLGIVLPPLLTIVFFLWAWNLITRYALEPVEGGAREVIVWATWDVPSPAPPADKRGHYQQVPDGRWIPRYVYDAVKDDPGSAPLQTPHAYYDRYVRLVYLPRTRVVPLFLLLFILICYLLGRFLAAGVGRWLWNAFESFIQRLPIIRKVYSSVKQVTDFVFTEQQIEFNRVVAVEYPRKGIWSIAFVTGEGILDVRAAANEPVLTLLVPTSPIPGTGFTVMVRKSEAVDLDITVDEAIQIIVSCGVVVPKHQQPKDAETSLVSVAASLASSVNPLRNPP